MKKIVALLLSLVLMVSCCSFTSFAETTGSSTTYTDKEIITIFISLLVEMSNRKLITDEQLISMFESLDLNSFYDKQLIDEDTYKTILGGIILYWAQNADSTKSNLPDAYSFGQGTFVVGQDLKAGTYDITCKSTSDEGLSGSISSFSDAYSSFGMDEYADMFGSLGSMYDSVSGMSVTTYDKNGLFDNYLTLKVNETARIILEDGGKLELSGGTADLTFVR